MTVSRTVSTVMGSVSVADKGSPPCGATMLSGLLYHG
jgi:hypothetical protein